MKPPIVVLHGVCSTSPTRTVHSDTTPQGLSLASGRGSHVCVRQRDADSRDNVASPLEWVHGFHGLHEHQRLGDRWQECSMGRLQSVLEGRAIIFVHTYPDAQWQVLEVDIRLLRACRSEA